MVNVECGKCGERHAREIRDRDSRIRRLEALLRETSEHDIHEDGCDVVIFDTEAEARPCTCLLDVIRKELAKGVGGAYCPKCGARQERPFSEHYEYACHACGILFMAGGGGRG